MILCVRASKALAATTALHPFALKVRLLFPLFSSFHNYPTTTTNIGIATTTTTISETHYRDLIFDTIEEKPWAFCNNNWVSDQFRAVIVDPELLIRVLDLIRIRPRIALRFFRWVEGQPGFKRSEFAFCVILEILAKNNLMRSAYWVVERVVCVNMHGIVDVLVDGYVGSEVSVKLLDLLLWVYTKKSMIEQCLLVFDKMMRNGFLPDVKNCNRILRMLRDRHFVAKAREVYRMMGENGIKPTIVTYNTLLDSYCKEGEVQRALELLSEMQRRGCFPNDVTYNVLINGLSKKGELKQANGLIGEMLKSGLKVSAYTYNPLICGYCKKGLVVEALGFEEEMAIRGATPTVATYNTLMYGLCKLGRMADARRRFF